MATLFENATLLDVEARASRCSTDRGEHLLVVMRGGHIAHRNGS